VKLTEITIPAVETTWGELCDGLKNEDLIEGKKITDWRYIGDIGSTELLLEGETVYRVVVIKETKLPEKFNSNL